MPPFFGVMGDNPNKWSLNIHGVSTSGLSQKNPIYRGRVEVKASPFATLDRFTPTGRTCELSCELLGLLALRRLLRIGDFTGVITVGTNMEPGVPGADTSSSSFHKAVKLKKL